MRELAERECDCGDKFVPTTKQQARCPECRGLNMRQRTERARKNFADRCSAVGDRARANGTSRSDPTVTVRFVDPATLVPPPPPEVEQVKWEATEPRSCKRAACENEFWPTHPRQAYCSAGCRQESKKGEPAKSPEPEVVSEEPAATPEPPAPAETSSRPIEWAQQELEAERARLEDRLKRVDAAVIALQAL